MTEAVLEIDWLDPADWQLLKEIRLWALRDSPHAFAARHVTEVAWDEPRWRARLTSAAWVVAREGVGGRRRAIGMAALVDGDQERSARYVESIWVAPTHRQLGVLRSLLDAVAGMAREIDVTTLLLWVMDDNETAIETYARLGFVPTGGDKQPVGSGRHELPMGRPL